MPVFSFTARQNGVLLIIVYYVKQAVRERTVPLFLGGMRMKTKVFLLVVFLCGMSLFSACGSEKADAVAEREMNEELSTNE